MASRNLCSLSDGFEKFQSCAIVVACTAADKPSNRILAAAATFDKMSATVRFKKFHDLGSRDFRSDEGALRRETSKRLHPGEFLLRFRPCGQLHLSVDHPWFIAQDRHVRGLRRPQRRLQLCGEDHPRHPKRRLAAAIGGEPWKRPNGGA